MPPQRKRTPCIPLIIHRVNPRPNGKGFVTYFVSNTNISPLFSLDVSITSWGHFSPDIILVIIFLGDLSNINFIVFKKIVWKPKLEV